MGILNGSFETANGDNESWAQNWTPYGVSYGWGLLYFGAPYTVVEGFGYGFVAWTVVYTSLVGTVSVGDTVTQVTSGATGTVARHDTGDKLIVIRPAWGTFNDVNDIQVDGANYVTGPTCTSAENQDSLDEYELSDLSNALFDAALESAEDFEEEWSDNELSLDEWPVGDDPLEFDAAGDEHEDFEEEWPSRHLVIDDRSVTFWPLAAGLSDGDCLTRLNALKATYEAHRVDTDHHTVADTVNGISAADATDESSAVTLMTEMWTDCWNHITDATPSYHRPDGAVSLVKLTMDAPSDYSDVKFLLTYLEAATVLHFDWANGSTSGQGYAESLIDLSSWNGATDSIGQLVVMEALENFESDWLDNDSSISEFTPGVDLDDYDFEDDGGPVAVEDFETTLDLSFPGTSSTAGSEKALSPSCGCQINCTGSFSGTAYIETRDPGSATWVRRETITTVPVDIQLGPGRVAVRIYTDTYTSGTPAATLHHQELE